MKNTSSLDVLMISSVSVLLDTFVEDNGGEEEEEAHEYDDSKAWLCGINRGKLTICNNTFHTFLYSLELQVKSTCRFGFTSKSENIRRLKESEEVVTIWKRMCTDSASEEANSYLLDEIITLYITVRGFRFTSRFVEQYKNNKMKGLQKERSLRSRISTINND